MPYYSFPTQAASDECPAVPKGVKVWGDATEQNTKTNFGAAMKVLAKALTDDPNLDKIHAEFLSPKDAEEKKTSKKGK